jgi:hypothetical protein
MAVLTTIHAAPVAAPAPSAAPSASGPVCSIQRSSSLWQLGIEAQELTTAIGLLAEQLETDDPEQRASALAELEAALLAEEGNKQALSAKADATCWVIEHLRGQAAYRQQQAKRLTDLARSDAGRADALEESLVFVLTQLQPSATRFSFPESRAQQPQVVGRRDRRRAGPRSRLARRHHHHQARQGRHQRSPQGRPANPRRPAPLPPQLAHQLGASPPPSEPSQQPNQPTQSNGSVQLRQRHCQQHQHAPH